MMLTPEDVEILHRSKSYDAMIASILHDTLDYQIMNTWRADRSSHNSLPVHSLTQDMFEYSSRVES